MAPYQTLFFDLDGTLTDSAEGIARCLCHAVLQCTGRQLQPADVVRFVGPPLRATLATLLDTQDTDLIEKAVVQYRERFVAVGMLQENKVYQGVPQMLAQLHAGGAHLFVVTSKPKLYADKIVAHFALDTYFGAVYGVGMDGAMDNKAELLAYAALNQRVNLKSALMVGDRENDITAAKKNAVRSAGVLYGYGSRLELLTAGADYLCRTPSDVVKVAQGE